MATIKLEVVSPDKMVYSEDISMLIVRSTAGDLGIMPKHAPLVAGLVPQAMRIKKEGTEELIAVAGGFVEVQPEKITVLASAAETKADIDAARAQKSYERAQKRISSKAADVDMARAEASLKRAMARLQVSGKNRVALVISHIGSKSNADHKGSHQGYGKAFQIFYRCNDIALRIDRHILRYQIILPQILLCRLKLYHRYICLRRCACESKSSA